MTPLPNPARTLDGRNMYLDLYTADQMHAYAAEQVAAERERIRSLVADDASAMTYQTQGQYRTALLRFLRC